MLRYFNKNLIHNKPITNDVRIPTINGSALAPMIVHVEDFNNFKATAPHTTGADK